MTFDQAVAELKQKLPDTIYFRVERVAGRSSAPSHASPDRNFDICHIEAHSLGHDFDLHYRATIPLDLQVSDAIAQANEWHSKRVDQTRFRAAGPPQGGL